MVASLFEVVAAVVTIATVVIAVAFVLLVVVMATDDFVAVVVTVGRRCPGREDGLCGGWGYRLDGHVDDLRRRRGQRRRPGCW